MMTPAAKGEMRKRGLAYAEKQFRAGEKYQLFLAVMLSVAGREPVPEWTREELWKIERGLTRGEIRDLNEAFGWTQKGEFHKKTRMEASRYRRYAQTIFLKLADARRNGLGMTPVTFEEIAESVGVGRSLVQQVWTRRKNELLRVTAGDSTGGHAYLVADHWDY